MSGHRATSKPVGKDEAVGEFICVISIIVDSHLPSPRLGSSERAENEAGETDPSQPRALVTISI